MPITSSPSKIGRLQLSNIVAVKPASLLEAFVRVRKSRNLEKWKAPAKGTVAKVELGLVYSTTNEKFLIQQVKEICISQPDPIAELPDIPIVTIPLAIRLPEPTMASFGAVDNLVEFKIVANREWCLKADDAFVSIYQKGTVNSLTMNQESLDCLNTNAFRFP